MSAAILRQYLQPSPTLRWHPWAPLVIAVLVIAFVFALGAAWGHSAATRMATDRTVYTAPSFRVMAVELEAMRPARHAVESARAFDVAVIRAAREKEAQTSLPHRLRISLEDSMFGMLQEDSHRRRDIDLRQMYRDGARGAAEHRLKNLSGTAPYWQRTATLCQEVGRGWDLGTHLDVAASAYSAILERTITAQQLAPLSGARCD
jgi:hypothetical protein